MLENNVRIIKHKVGLLNLAEELGNVSKACKTMGLSRDTFYRYKAAVECKRPPAPPSQPVTAMI
jgi:ACT domain-containing protein